MRDSSLTRKTFTFAPTDEAKYSRVDEINFVEDSL